MPMIVHTAQMATNVSRPFIGVGQIRLGDGNVQRVSQPPRVIHGQRVLVAQTAHRDPALDGAVLTCTSIAPSSQSRSMMRIWPINVRYGSQASTCAAPGGAGMCG